MGDNDIQFMVSWFEYAGKNGAQTNQLRLYPNRIELWRSKQYPKQELSNKQIRADTYPLERLQIIQYSDITEYQITNQFNAVWIELYNIPWDRAWDGEYSSNVRVPVLSVRIFMCDLEITYEELTAAFQRYSQVPSREARREQMKNWLYYDPLVPRLGKISFIVRSLRIEWFCGCKRFYINNFQCPEEAMQLETIGKGLYKIFILVPYGNYSVTMDLPVGPNGPTMDTTDEIHFEKVLAHLTPEHPEAIYRTKGGGMTIKLVPVDGTLPEDYVEASDIIVQQTKLHTEHKEAGGVRNVYKIKAEEVVGHKNSSVTSRLLSWVVMLLLDAIFLWGMLSNFEKRWWLFLFMMAAYIFLVDDHKNTFSTTAEIRFMENEMQIAYPSHCYNHWQVQRKKVTYHIPYGKHIGCLYDKAKKEIRFYGEGICEESCFYDYNGAIQEESAYQGPLKTPTSQKNSEVFIGIKQPAVAEFARLLYENTGIRTEGL